MLRKIEQFPLAGLIDLGMISGILAALLYITGWYYAYHYYGSFHLDLSGIDIQREEFVLYAFSVYKANSVAVLSCLICSIGLYLLLKHMWRAIQDAPARKIGRRLNWLRATIFISGPISLFLLFIFFSSLGSATGKHVFEIEKKGDFPSFPRVKVWLSEGKQEKRAEAWARGCYRLLRRDKENTFIFPTDGISDRIPTEIIANSRIAEVRMLPLYQTSNECR